MKEFKVTVIEKDHTVSYFDMPTRELALKHFYDMYLDTCLEMKIEEVEVNYSLEVLDQLSDSLYRSDCISSIVLSNDLKSLIIRNNRNNKRLIISLNYDDAKFLNEMDKNVSELIKKIDNFSISKGRVVSSDRKTAYAKIVIHDDDDESEDKVNDIVIVSNSVDFIKGKDMTSWMEI